MSKTKLELTWIGKDKRPKLEPRILLENPGLSYHAKFRRYSPSPPAPLPEGEGSMVTAAHSTAQPIEEKSLKSPSPSGRGVGERVDIFDNKLIFGDNLLALKALEQAYAGKVKCVFIDPPYNTGSAFTHYDDGLEHSIWLSLMRDRLEIIRSLLADDGSLWITIDDNEAHYLKVLCDEVFGRGNFVANVVWQKRTSPDNRLRLGDAHDSILVYKKNVFLGKETFNQLPVSDTRTKDFKNPDNDPRGAWASTDFTGMTGHATPSQFYTITSPNGAAHPPPDGRCWALAEETFKKLLADNRVWFGKDGKARPRLKRFLNEMEGQNSWSWWTNSEVGHNQEAKKEIVALFGANNAFDTPKPERLIERILNIATNPDDLVLDSFAGSGTTGAVAHKMGRRWIMIELGEHCHTHIIPRLKKVIDGEDQGGISKAVNWRGGGGFRYYSLAPSLLEQDRWGNWIVNKNYNPSMLAEALCKLEGFTYAPSDSQWWNHGVSSEQDFIYVTTQNLSHQQLQELAEEVGGDRSLLVCCAAFRSKADVFPNLTLKKIPKMVLSRCEWAHDDYSLNVANLPMAAPAPPSPPAPLPEGEGSKSDTRLKKGAGHLKKDDQTLDLFSENDT